MKHIIFIMCFVAMGFTCVAQNNKGSIDNNEVNRVKKELINQVLTPMRKTADQLLRDIHNAEALCDKLKDRKLSIVASPQTGDSQLEGYLEQVSFNDMFEKKYGKWFVKQDVLDMVNDEPESAIKKAYLLVLDMKESLNKPYDEESNNRFIKEAVNVKDAILPSHKADFDQLVSQINDYNYYMFELARLFVAADEDNYQKSVIQLVQDEDAKYLLDVPYTCITLRTYIDNNGKLTHNKKTELKTACSDAFPDF